MSDWQDVMTARREAAELVGDARQRESGEATGVVLALLAVRAELRALGVLIDHARGDARSG